DWYLYGYTESPQDPWDLVKPHHWQPRKNKTTAAEEAVLPAHYGTAFSLEDGNGIQQGWAGRSR
ncbi:MAG: IS256 family transposase, partial [Arthrobacter sp.]|nr:IS256 family transposase [Arthrobacter sp.]